MKTKRSSCRISRRPLEVLLKKMGKSGRRAMTYYRGVSKCIPGILGTLIAYQFHVMIIVIAEKNPATAGYSAM
jgi:hypothetical protein